MSQKISKSPGGSAGTSATCLAYYEAAMRFYGATPWRIIESMKPLAVFPPGQDTPLVASVLGAGGEEYGLGVYRGDDVFEHVRALVAVAEPNGIIVGVQIVHGERALAMHLEPRGVVCAIAQAPSPLLMEALTALFRHLSGERPPSSRRRRGAR
jgi:hypothetical protein